MNFLIIENDVVSNIIIADSKETAETVTGLEAIALEGSEPWIGWKRSGDTWIKPEEPTEEPTEE